MEVVVTAGEILDKDVDVWEEFCKDRGINPWAMNEGLMDSSEKFTLSEEEAIKYRFLKKVDRYSW